MITFFRKLLIRIGKIIPFLFAFIVAFGYIENLYAIVTDSMVEYYNGETFYYCPISMYIADVIYIDWFDVLIVWILCIALELCKYTYRCAYYLTLNLPIRFTLEHVYLDKWTVFTLAIFMALGGLYCVYGGF